MIGIYDIEDAYEKADEKPFDVGFESGRSGETLFDCPYDYTTEASLRQRHEWLDGFLSALTQSGRPSFL
jgi:ribosome modulation factor